MCLPLESDYSGNNQAGCFQNENIQHTKESGNRTF
jgi:hypothetical protein